MDTALTRIVAVILFVALAVTAFLMGGSGKSAPQPRDLTGSNPGEAGAVPELERADFPARDDSDLIGTEASTAKVEAPTGQDEPSVRRATSSLERGLISIANHLFGEALRVPSDVEMTEDQWEECRKLYMASAQEVGKWGNELGKQWDLYVPQMTRQGSYDEELVPESGGLRPPEKTVQGQRTLSQWTRNDKGESVRRVYRINPGTFEAFDDLAKGYDSAERYQRETLMKFFARVLRDR